MAGGAAIAAWSGFNGRGRCSRDTPSLAITPKPETSPTPKPRRHFWPSGFDLEAWQGARLRTHIGDREYRAKDARCQNRVNKAWAHEFLPFVMVVMSRVVVACCRNDPAGS